MMSPAFKLCRRLLAVMPLFLLLSCPGGGQKTPKDEDPGLPEPGPNLVESSWGRWEGVNGSYYISDRLIEISSRQIGFEGRPMERLSYRISSAAAGSIQGRLDTSPDYTWGVAALENVADISLSAFEGSPAYRVSFTNGYTYGPDTISQAAGRDSSFSGRLALTAPPGNRLRALGFGGAGGIALVVTNLKNDADSRIVVTDPAAQTTGNFDASLSQGGNPAPTIPGDSYTVSLAGNAAAGAAITLATDFAAQDLGEIAKPRSGALAISAESVFGYGKHSGPKFLYLGSSDQADIVLSNTGSSVTPNLMLLILADDPDLSFIPRSDAGGSGLQFQPWNETDTASELYGRNAYYAENLSLASDSSLRFSADIALSRMDLPGADHEDRQVVLGYFQGGELLWFNTLVYRFYRESFLLSYSGSPSSTQTGRTAGLVITPDGIALPLPYDPSVLSIELPRYNEGKTYISVVNGQHRFGVDTLIPANPLVVENGTHSTRETAIVLTYGESYEGQASPLKAPDILAIDPTASPRAGSSETLGIEYVGLHTDKIRLVKTNGSFDYTTSYDYLPKGRTSYPSLVFHSYMGTSLEDTFTIDSPEEGVTVSGGPYGEFLLTGGTYESGDFTFTGSALRVTVPTDFSGDTVRLRLWYDYGSLRRYTEFSLPTAFLP